MASFFAKKVAKHVMKESAENKFGTEVQRLCFPSDHD